MVKRYLIFFSLCILIFGSCSKEESEELTTTESAIKIDTTFYKVASTQRDNGPVTTWEYNKHGLEIIEKMEGKYESYEKKNFIHDHFRNIVSYEKHISTGFVHVYEATYSDKNLPVEIIYKRSDGLIYDHFKYNSDGFEIGHIHGYYEDKNYVHDLDGKILFYETYNNTGNPALFSTTSFTYNGINKLSSKLTSYGYPTFDESEEWLYNGDGLEIGRQRIRNEELLSGKRSYVYDENNNLVSYIDFMMIRTHPDDIPYEVGFVINITYQKFSIQIP